MSKRRLSTDELITELIAEIRCGRVAATKRDERVEAELNGIRIALSALGQDFREFRAHVLRHEDESGKALRLVAAHAGVIDPHEKNGR